TAHDRYAMAAEKAPQELAYVLAQAEMLVTLDRPLEALSLLREKLPNFEHSPALRDAIGQLLIGQGRYDEAVEMLRQATVLATDDLAIRERLGLALVYAKRYREAHEVLSRLVREDRYARRADLLVA